MLALCAGGDPLPREARRHQTRKTSIARTWANHLRPRLERYLRSYPAEPGRAAIARIIDDINYTLEHQFFTDLDAHAMTTIAGDLDHLVMLTTETPPTRKTSGERRRSVPSRTGERATVQTIVPTAFSREMRQVCCEAS